MTRSSIDNMLGINEATLLRWVTEAAEMLKWLVYHTHRSDRSEKGFPDLVLVRPPRVIFAELKGPRGRFRPEQTVWLETLLDCPGVETYMWRPADWPEIERILKGT